MEDKGEQATLAETDSLQLRDRVSEIVESEVLLQDRPWQQVPALENEGRVDSTKELPGIDHFEKVLGQVKVAELEEGEGFLYKKGQSEGGETFYEVTFTQDDEGVVHVGVKSMGEGGKIDSVAVMGIKREDDRDILNYKYQDNVAGTDTIYSSVSSDQ